MKNVTLFLMFFLILCALENSYPQSSITKVIIISDKDFISTDNKYDLGKVTTVSPSLTFKSSESAYYNSCYLDTKKSNSILHEDFNIDISLKNITPRRGRYDFELSLRNLNAKTDYSYWDNDNPKKKQKVDDIYWGFQLNVSHNGKEESIVVWLKKSMYNINNTPWKEFYNYPDPEYEYSSNLKIISWTSNTSMIYWGNDDIYLTQVPYYIDAINSIQVLVGCQAYVKFGKAVIRLGAYSTQEELDKHYSNISELVKLEKYFSAISEVKQWIMKNGTTTEYNAFTLAYCQIGMFEYKDCIETCNSLIDFKGDYFKQAYLFRGLSKEMIGDIPGALSDYNNSGEIGIESYNKLIQQTKMASKPQLQKGSINRSTNKPQLRK